MGAVMMSRVPTRRQNQASALQPTDRPRHDDAVRPSVELVRRTGERQERNRRRVKFRPRREEVADLGPREHGESEAGSRRRFAVHGHPVPFEHRLGVAMVFAERRNQGGERPASLGTSETVAGPVDATCGPVRCESP